MQAVNTLGRYHIIRELARSNDIVYEAIDPASGKKVALKELLIAPNLAGQARQDRIQRFTREARAAARLKHPNIVRIIDHGQVQGRYYIAMEFLEGQSLRDVLRQRGTLPLQEALRIAAAVADGLDYAHKNGVVHRDVKPDNVHLEPDGRVVITDFGIARLTFEPSLTADGQIFGTPSYMSPEQIAGKEIDKRSDLFSLGVMLYEMVAGRKPFTGDSVITITYNIMNVEPAPIAGVPAGVDQMVRRAIAKEAERRYRTAAELAEDLRQVMQGRTPRFAAVPLPPSAPASRAPRSAAPPPPRRPSLPNGGGAPRPMPQPQFGGGGAGRPGPPVPPPGLPGVRPPSRPMSAYAPAGAGQPPGGPPGLVASPIAAPVGGVAPQPQPVNAPAWSPTPTARGGTDYLWLLGWLALAVVVGGMIVGLVWAVVMARDKLQQDTVLRASAQIEQRATRDFQAGKFEEAQREYLQAADGAGGLRQQVMRKNAAVAAVSAAEQRMEAGRPEEAERLSRQALSINPDLASAYNVLGRALTAQSRIDEAVQTFGQTVAAAARERDAGASGEELKSAQSAAANAPLWKAEALYNDGLHQMDRNPMLARQRLEDAVQAAPKSPYAQNARTLLARLEADSGASGGGVGLGANPGDLARSPGGGSASGGAGEGGRAAPARRRDAGDPPMTSPPAGWDPSYRNY